MAPFRETAIFWNEVWKSAGKPLNCQLFNIMKRCRNVYHYQIRKLKKSENLIKRNKLLDACLNGDNNIFKEIKKLRHHEADIASTVDGVSENISDHFKDIYSKLYNSVDDSDEMLLLKNAVENEINSGQLNEVENLTPDVMKLAASKLSDGKGDPVYSFSSDCFKNGSDILFSYLSIAFKSFLIHGHFTLFLLLATLIPLVKDRLASINSSKNYRSIAISSLTLKLFDWILLILYGDNLRLDELQFAYQAGCSTTMCTWSIVETVSYFLRNGSNVYACCMDMTKAFDLIKHSVLFLKLKNSGIPPIYLRLVMFIYMQQYANVSWNGSSSSIFSLSNGVRQGAVASAVFYCFYSNILFQNLRRSGYGCWLNGKYHGIFGYSDDNLLLAPSPYALQQMLQVCESFAADHNMKFSTDVNPQKCKTKCIAFLKKNENLPEIKLCGNSLPWVDQIKHLGHIVDNKGCHTNQDIIVKRAQFVNKNMELNQEFQFAGPKTRFKINQIYNSHFYGSPIWNLFGNAADMFLKSYNRSVRITLDLPLTTHRNLLETVTGCRHLHSVLCSRFLGFIEKVRASQKTIPKLLLSHIMYDVRSTTGSNLRNIMLETDKDDIAILSKSDSEQVKYHPLSKDDEWKKEALIELLDIREGQLEINGLINDEIQQMIETICTN